MNLALNLLIILGSLSKKELIGLGGLLMSVSVFLQRHHHVLSLFQHSSQPSENYTLGDKNRNSSCSNNTEKCSQYLSFPLKLRGIIIPPVFI